MIEAKNQDGKFSIPIKLIGKNKEMIVDFYIDTGFSGLLKIDKKLFDELGLEIIRKEVVSLGNHQNEQVDVGRVKYSVDAAYGESEVLAIGWGGRNLLGINFLKIGDMLLIIDNAHGMFLTSERGLAYKVGEAVYKHYHPG